MDAKHILIGAALVGASGGFVWANLPAKIQLAPNAPGVVAAEPRAQPIATALVRYSGCNEVRALGKDPLYRGDPGYREEMDGDSDGVACEPIRY